MSASRVTRNAEAPEDLHPRKQPVQVGLDELLEQDELERLARSARDRDEARPSDAGTFTRAKAGRFSFLSVSSTASESERFETNGNGCAGSNASGVRTGKTTLSK